MTTNMWRIEEAPEYEIEQTPGAWVLWGPCNCSYTIDGEECPLCGDTGSKVISSCTLDEDGTPTNKNMIFEAIGLDHWTPVKTQHQS